MASDNVFLTALGNGSQVPITGTNRGGGTGDENPVARLRSTLTKLLGGDDSLTMTTSQAVDLDAYAGPPRAAMGLQVAVSGRVGRTECRRQAAATVQGCLYFTDTPHPIYRPPSSTLTSRSTVGPQFPVPPFQRPPFQRPRSRFTPPSAVIEYQDPIKYAQRSTPTCVPAVGASTVPI